MGRLTKHLGRFIYYSNDLLLSIRKVGNKFFLEPREGKHMTCGDKLKFSRGYFTITTSPEKLC